MKTTDTIQNYLIFTDLDGTLLNHHTYSFSDANEMLLIIKNKNIPLVIVTSKTKDEVIEVQKSLEISLPFIIENGAGIFIPTHDDYELISLGKSYAETLLSFQKYQNYFLIKGFHEMSDDEVSLLTGLSLSKANSAKKRTFSEPFVLDYLSDLPALKKLANDDGFDVVKGGRFYHLITLGQDKANALRAVQQYYENLDNRKYTTIALGDGENDITMLQAVDQAIIIKKADGTHIECDIKNSIKSEYIGPKGWNESLKRFLNVK